MAVVDGNLKVYGVEGLRIADASVLPGVTTGNTMAPCVVIGERAAGILEKEHVCSPEAGRTDYTNSGGSKRCSQLWE